MKLNKKKKYIYLVDIVIKIHIRLDGLELDHESDKMYISVICIKKMCKPNTPSNL